MQVKFTKIPGGSITIFCPFRALNWSSLQFKGTAACWAKPRGSTGESQDSASKNWLKGQISPRFSSAELNAESNARRWIIPSKSPRRLGSGSGTWLPDSDGGQTAESRLASASGVSEAVQRLWNAQKRVKLQGIKGPRNQQFSIFRRIFTRSRGLSVLIFRNDERGTTRSGRAIPRIDL